MCNYFRVRAYRQEGTTTIRIDGVPTSSGSWSATKSLTVSVPKEVYILGTASNGATRTYKFTFVRLADSNSNAASLNQVSLFSPSITSYSVTLPAGGYSVTLSGSCAGHRAHMA
jgi:hypothetical protein